MKGDVREVIERRAEVSLSLSWEEFETLFVLAQAGMRVGAAYGPGYARGVAAGDSLFGVVLRDPEAVVRGLRDVQREGRMKRLDGLGTYRSVVR